MSVAGAAKGRSRMQQSISCQRAQRHASPVCLILLSNLLASDLVSIDAAGCQESVRLDLVSFVR